MTRPPPPPALVLALLATLAACERPDGREAPSGDGVAAELERTETAALPPRADELLATGRPWRAARTMREYLARDVEATDDEVLLSARAEAGWGAWDRVLELLQGREDALEGRGRYLLARARDEVGDPGAAVAAYEAFLAEPGEAGDTLRSAATLRLELARLRSRAPDGTVPDVEAVTGRLGEAALWGRILVADALAAAGDTAAVRRVVADLDDGIPGLRAWRARVRAAEVAGDHAAARALANRARAWAGTDGTRSEFLVSAARQALAMGDTAPAREALRSAIELDDGGPYARDAADLLRQGDPTPEERLAIARTLVAQGLQEEALEGYRDWLEGAQAGASERDAVRLEYADALYYAGHFEEAVEALEPLGDDRDARLDRARSLTRLGEHDRAARIYLDEARSGTTSGRREEGLFLAADVLHDAGRPDTARALYARILDGRASAARRGLVTMRMAGIDFVGGDHATAARVWDEYRRRYASSDEALQATYWAGRAHEAMGDSAAARERYERVLEMERDSYYALKSSERLGRPFWPIPVGDAPPEDPAARARVERWMAPVDLLGAAGFPEEASAEVERLAAEVGRDRATRYALAEALAERVYGMRAIRLGIGLRGDGPPDARLLRILHPFPYRTLVVEEATERGFDPMVAAGLMRQESLFEARITSHVGARGLMQLMPATGRELAEAEGIEPWDPDLLYRPEVNVHLGTRLVADHLEDYDGSLPAVFAAYNAGPHRVGWWQEFPEWGDDELFTERIPYRETRNYVKILTRNRAVYDGLYGEGPPAA